MEFIYDLAILGGTFDHFHRGHEELIMTALKKARHVIIGISKPKLYQHKLLSDFIEPYEEREKVVRNYVRANDWSKRVTYIPIEDIFGNSLQEKSIEAIFVTEENVPAVTIINAKRKEIGFQPLRVEMVSSVMATDNQLITSERIRMGEIDRDGFVYQDIFANKTQLVLPTSLRSELQEPLGKILPETRDVIKQFTEKSFVIAVGDIVSAKLTEGNYLPAIRIIDRKNRRAKIADVLYENSLTADNPNGTIQPDAVTQYKKALDTFFETKIPQTLIVTGEEDLLALPAILLAPLGATVLYGQYGKGVVVNLVTEELKRRIILLLNKFS